MPGSKERKRVVCPLPEGRSAFCPYSRAETPGEPQDLGEGVDSSEVGSIPQGNRSAKRKLSASGQFIRLGGKISVVECLFVMFGPGFQLLYQCKK